MDSEILDANAAFYEAFGEGDVDRMDALWARRAPVACIHPGWSALIGRQAVMASWRAILNAGAPAVRCEAVKVHLLGEVAFVVCTERIDDGRLAATNVFVREDGDWRLVHHQAGPVAAEAEEDEAPSRGPLN